MMTAVWATVGCRGGRKRVFLLGLIVVFIAGSGPVRERAKANAHHLVVTRSVMNRLPAGAPTTTENCGTVGRLEQLGWPAASHLRKDKALLNYFAGWKLWCAGSQPQALAVWSRNAETIGARFEGTAVWAASDASKAWQWFEIAVALLPNSRQAAAGLAEASMRLGTPMIAADIFRRLLTKGSATARDFAGLAICEYQLGDFVNSEKHIRAAVDLDRANWSYVQILGGLLLRRGNYHDAEVAFRAAISLDPRQAESHSGLAIALMNRGLFADASPEAVTALRIAYSDELARSLFLTCANIAGPQSQGVAVVEFYVGTIRAVPHALKEAYEIIPRFLKIGRWDIAMELCLQLMPLAAAQGVETTAVTACEKLSSMLSSQSRVIVRQ